ncbi:hypothetical protein J7J47_20835 [Halomonas sp. ISL-60]|uniref:GFA family protein n=1 Tax=Halomonas sp. ISL-56 TaxID=2819149 RepID=UPI001BE962FE|nr:DUF6151 family protein [Halomonas sp. ISL-56]MBT2774678.1 hypothetical protein [Halomonas sp. ISL-60]MBT2803305.1 hypothetical protein [Halomonas sp. ISL-56]
MPIDTFLVECSCGQVAVELVGAPIYCTVCHCDDCQFAADELAKLLPPEPVMDQFLGTPYVLHRNDRYAVVRGQEHLHPYKFRVKSPTSRIVATCCNSPLFVTFENSQHWISLYRQRFVGETPALQSRIATKFLKDPSSLPTDPPAYKSFPLKLVVRLVVSRLQMIIGR